MEIQGAKALITGASRRIGRQIALTLAEAGADILIHYHESRNDALDLKRRIEDAGRSAWTLKADFSPGRVPLMVRIRRLVREAERLAGGIDILVNNAAIYYPTPFGDVSEKDWEAFQTVNLKVPFFLSQEAGAMMMRRGRGKIIHLADWTGLRPQADYLPYAISKAGLIAAAQGMAKAMAPYVQVNCIGPGPILPAAGQTKGQQKAAAGRSLAGRFGDPDDIAKTVRFLCVDTDYITGAFIPVDGGSLIA